MQLVLFTLKFIYIQYVCLVEASFLRTSFICYLISYVLQLVRFISVSVSVSVSIFMSLSIVVMHYFCYITFRLRN